MDQVAERLAAVDGRIAAAVHAAGRDPSEITRIVVTKLHSVELIERLHALGVRDIGENRQQELTAKHAAVDLPGLRWHFVGQAQRNKARAIRAAASVIHSVDRVRLVDALDAVGGEPLDVLLQINLTEDPRRGGAQPAEAAELASAVTRSETLRLRGVMAVAPRDEDPRRGFERLARCAEDVRVVSPDATWISAGMSADFTDAIACGATHLRIGSAITGPRPERG